MSANGSRWGWSSPRRRPALELACTPARRRFGCPASSRHTSPPAYPVAPVTPTVHVCVALTMHDHTQPCMTVHRSGVPGHRYLYVRLGAQNAGIGTYAWLRHLLVVRVLGIPNTRTTNR